VGRVGVAPLVKLVGDPRVGLLVLDVEQVSDKKLVAGVFLEKEGI